MLTIGLPPVATSMLIFGCSMTSFAVSSDGLRHGGNQSHRAARINDGLMNDLQHAVLVRRCAGMSVEDDSVAGGDHADAVVDERAGRIGDWRESADQADRRVLQQHQAIVAAEGTGLDVFHAGRLGRAQNVLAHLVFITAEVGLLDRHRRQFLIAIQDTVANGGDDVLAPLQRHANQLLLRCQPSLDGIIHRRIQDRSRLRLSVASVTVSSSRTF